MAKILGFNLSKEDYLSLADSAFSKGETEQSITYLDKALSLDARYVDASLALSVVYASLGAWGISNATLFKSLSEHPDEEDKGRIFYQLAMNFADLNLPDVAEYYLRDIADAYDIQIPEGYGEPVKEEGAFRVVYPRGEDYYETLIEQAYELVRDRKFDEAIAVVDEIPKESKCKGAANHLVLVALMMKNDVDSVIANAQKMLEEDEDNLSVKCALATAYLMEEKMPEAYAVLDNILQKEYDKVEDILIILPLLVNLEVHAQVVKYTKKMIEKTDLQQNMMVWLSQALYNLGQKAEAKKVMHKVRTVFGEFSPADYYLELYDTEPNGVAYSMSLPYVEKIARYKLLDTFLKMSPADIAVVLDSEDKDALELKKIIKWAFVDDNEKLKLLIVDRLAMVRCAWAEDFVREQLISADLSFELASRLLFCLMPENRFRFSFDIVAQDRFKSINVTLPRAFFKLPNVLHSAVGYCVSDIVYTDEEPNIYLAELTNIVNSLVTLDDNGKVKYSRLSGLKIATMKSMRTLVGVLLCKVYEEDGPDMRQVTIDRYGLNEKTFDKYYKIIFGDDGDSEIDDKDGAEDGRQE